MNKIFNKLLLTGNKFMPELHLKQPEFTCVKLHVRIFFSACRPFTKHRKRIKKYWETGNLNHLYGNELEEACFAHDAKYSDSKDLAKRTISDKILKDKACEIAKSPKYDGYQRALASMVYNFENRIRSNSDRQSGSECKWKTSWRITWTSN